MSLATDNEALPAVAWNREALGPGAEQDAVVKGITGEIDNKGFLAVLTVGFVYEWNKGALDWE